ncbi:MAG TPA: PIG-L deacetylase family protein [Tepidisphaeraceae bacterium]|nr:PIG-L deacetylase family protein [Tepidisphaeraceae bacterium]
MASQQPERKTALAFLAHPDDAEFLCAGTLIRLRDAGWEVHIATATPGDCGSATQDRWEISAVRTNEARRAASLIGATYHCLDERDIFVVFDKPTLKKAIDLFRRVSPSLVFTHAAKDYMMDHEMVSLLARAASFAYGIPNVSHDVPRPAGAVVPYLYYCDPFEGVDPYGNPSNPTTLIDITAVYDRKAEMLACHASQREWLRAHHGMDEYMEAMRRHAASRGKLAGALYAEGFVQHRGHSYPHDDLLSHLLPPRN